ncbi:TEA domain-containing protein [Mycena kentingensis (nom. inval.)]|nr:TEA domain-containing protein [Mycena kentingensis (nom. inval.)]
MSSDCAGTSPSFKVVGRRSYWKMDMTSTNPSPIWPPELEEALIKALEEYTYDQRRNPNKTFQRNPLRNRYISNYIEQNTGILRTAKQVGSRLQQMRESCKDEHVRKLIQGCSTAQDEPIGSEHSSSPEPDPAELRLAEHPPETDHVTIQLAQSRSAVTVFRGADDHELRVDCSADTGVPPVMTFSLPVQITVSHYYSFFRVRVGNKVLYTDVSALSPMVARRKSRAKSKGKGKARAKNAQFEYTTALIPTHWEQLWRGSGIFEVVVEQDILQSRTQFDPDEPSPASPGPEDYPIRSVVYRFMPIRGQTPDFRPPPLDSEPQLPPEFPSRTLEQVPDPNPPSRSPSPEPAEDDPSVLYTYNCDWTAGAGQEDYAAQALARSQARRRRLTSTPPLQLEYPASNFEREWSSSGDSPTTTSTAPSSYGTFNSAHYYYQHL